MQSTQLQICCYKKHLPLCLDGVFSPMETREADKGVVEGVLEAKDALKVVESGKISSKFTAWYFCL